LILLLISDSLYLGAMQTSRDSEIETNPHNDGEISPDFLLWKDFKSGNAQAFELMVRQFYPVLLNYGFRLVKDRDFVQDCLQDFLVDLWARKERLNDVHSIQGYLFLSFRRRLFREKKRGVWINSATELHDDLDFEGSLNIESLIIENEQYHENEEKLKKQIESLTRRQREVIYLRFTQSLDYGQIAEIMRINHQSAVNLVYEAIRVLKKNWFVSISFFISVFF